MKNGGFMKSIIKGKFTLRHIMIILLVIIFGVAFVTDTPPPPFVKISGRTYFVFTRELNLFMSPTTKSMKNDMRNLKRLRWLKKLYMNFTHVTDINFLNNMNYMEVIIIRTLPDYIIEDWSPLTNCKKLEVFGGYNLNMTDLSVFKELTNLKELYIETFGGLRLANENLTLTDISDVQHLVNLEKFGIVGKEITNISALRHCSKLISLELFGTIAKDYSVLFELPNLEFLMIDKGVLTESEIKALEEKGVTVIEHEFSNGIE